MGCGIFRFLVMETCNLWQSAPSILDLEDGEIHLWLASLESTLPKVRLLDLSHPEQQKAKAISNESVRTQYLVSRWLTRQLLADYLKAEPASLFFGFAKNSKPCLLNIDRSAVKIQFNRSHAGGWLILAVSKADSVGVDIEQIKPRSQMKEIIKRWFEISECKHFQSLHKNEREQYFYHCWTQKEAVLKAWGVGLVELTQYPYFAERSWKYHFKTVSGFAACVACTDLKPKILKFYLWNEANQQAKS